MILFNSKQRGPLLPFLFSIVLIVSILAAYHNTLRSPFLFDDYNNILNNPFIQIDRLDIPSLGRVITDNQPTRNRPVAYLTFAVNYYFGGDNPLGYHIINILIHISTALVVFRLFFLYLLRLGQSEDRSLTIAFIACFVWALNPIQTNAVTYIVQRMTSLCVLFMSASLLTYFQARILSVAEDRAAQRMKIFILSIMSFMSWGAALMTKEIAVIMPLLFLLHEVFFFEGLSAASIRRWKWLYLSVILLMVGGVIFHIGPDIGQRILAGYATRDFSLYERLLTETRVVVRYMSLFVVPLPSRLTLYYDYQISTALFAPPATFFSIVTLGILIAGAVSYAQTFRVISFGIFWTLICLIVESTVVPLEIIFEHRFYLPSIGFSLGLVYLAYMAVSRFRLSDRPVTLITVFVLTTLVILTFMRNETWKDKVSFGRDAVLKAPNSVRSHVALANAYLEAGYVASGKESLDKAYMLDSTNIVVLANLYRLYATLHAEERSASFMNELKKSILAGNFICTQANALDPLARILFTQKKYSDVVFILETLTRCGVPAVVYQNLAVSYQKLGDKRKAIENFEKALQLQPDYPFYLYSLSYLYKEEGNREKAREMFSRLKIISDAPQVQTYIRELESVLHYEDV